MSEKRDLRKDLEICEVATRGPWEQCQFQFDMNEWGVHCPKHEGVTIDDGITNNALTICRGMTGPNRVNNSQFIAAAREGWPEAINRAIEAEEELEKYRRVIKMAKADGSLVTRVIEKAFEALERTQS